MSAENQGRPANQQSAPPALPRPKKSKPSFAEFFECLSEAITAESKKDDLPAVVRIVKQGYSGEVQPEQNEKVFGLIKQYRSVDRLLVQLSTTLPPRPSAIARILRNRLRMWAAEQVGYPALRSGEDRLFNLESWIKQASTTQPTDSQLPPEWLRMALACLINESDPLVRCEAVHQLLATIAATAKPQQPGPFRTDTHKFLREVGKLLSARTLSPAKVYMAIQFAHPLAERLRHDEADLIQVRLDLGEANKKSHKLTEENQQLQEQVEKAAAREKELQRQLREAAEQLALEKDRLKEHDAHWEKTSQQKLARQRHQIVTEIGHELQEARLALDRESPNAQMALNRVRRAEETLRKSDVSK